MHKIRGLNYELPTWMVASLGESTPRLISQDSPREQVGINIGEKLRIGGGVGPSGTPTTSRILEAHPQVWKAVKDIGRAYIENRRSNAETFHCSAAEGLREPAHIASLQGRTTLWSVRGQQTFQK